jgi:chromosome segregation ATPase
MIEKISDSDTLKYIFMIGEGKTVSTENFEFISQFPKNYLLPKLKEFFEKFSELGDKLEQQKKYTESLVKEIDSMTDGRSLTEKEKLIEGYKKSVVEQKEYTGIALSEKEKLIEGYKKSVVEQKEYTGQALTAKEKLIEGYKKSIVEQKEYTGQALTAKEKLIRGHEDSIQKLKKIIQGHEASIKEQKDYIENLEKNIHDLESRLAKLAFWKKK